MTRARWVVLALFLAVPVHGKTLIVAAEAKKNTVNGYAAGERAAKAARLQLLTSIFDAFGASYVVIPAEAMKTQWARTGVVTWDFGTSSARTETFDAVVHAMFTRKGTGTPDFAGYRPDFLTVAGADSAPTVPQLMLGSIDASESLLSGSGNMFTTAAYCSAGVSTYQSAGGGTGTHDEEGTYYPQGRPESYGGMAVSGHAILARSSVAARGISTILAQGSNPIGTYFDEFFRFSSNWDSTGRASAPDTAKVWMVRNLHTAGKARIIYCDPNEGGVGDGSEALNNITERLDVTTIMIALAALDSAAGGRVFDNRAKTPLAVSITIDGLCSRSSATNSGGIVPSDTTSFYATVDSLNRYDIKAVFGVNIDSVCCYPRDLQYVKDRYRSARFTPQSRAGLDTAVTFAPTGGNTRRHRAVDTFGRYRNQSMAYGPARGAAADTSLYARLIYARALGDSMWGPARSSAFALPPEDDWSPYNLRAWQVDMSRGATPDSVLFAYARAGFRGIRINGSWRKARPANSPTNPFGYYPEQGRYETADRSLSVNLIAHNGGSTYGNLAFAAVIDSTAPGTTGSTPASIGWYAANRFWIGLFGYSPLSLANGSGVEVDENASGEIQRCRIFRVSAQELAGTALNQSYKSTLRPSWWAIRKVVMPIQIMNRVAGRPIMAIDYPENINP